MSFVDDAMKQSVKIYPKKLLQFTTESNLSRKDIGLSRVLKVNFFTGTIDNLIFLFKIICNFTIVKPLPHGTTLSAIRATALLANRPRASTRTEISRYWNLIPYYYY